MKEPDNVVPSFIAVQIKEEPAIHFRHAYETGVRKIGGREIFYPLNIIFTNCEEFLSIIRNDNKDDC